MPHSPQLPNPAVRQMVDRLRLRRDRRADLTFVRDHGKHPGSAEALLALYRSDPFDATALMARAGELHSAKLLSEQAHLEWSFKAAAHPASQRWAEAERLLDQLEQLAEAQNEPVRARDLAAVERHRSWIAYQRRENTRALMHSIRAYELDGWVTDLHNILCVLVRLGEDATARALLADAERSLDPSELEQLHTLGAADPDLATLLS